MPPLNGLGQQKGILLCLWRLEVWTQCVGYVSSSWKPCKNAPSLCYRWLPPIRCMPCLADTWLPSLTLSLLGLLPYASVSLYPNLPLLSFIKPQSLNLASALSSMNLSWLYLQKLFLNKVMFMGTRDWDLSMCLGETVKLPITCLLYWASELDFIWLKHSITKIKLEVWF